MSDAGSVQEKPAQSCLISPAFTALIYLCADQPRSYAWITPIFGNSSQIVPSATLPDGQVVPTKVEKSGPSSTVPLTLTCRLAKLSGRSTRSQTVTATTSDEAVASGIALQAAVGTS